MVLLIRRKQDKQNFKRNKCFSLCLSGIGQHTCDSRSSGNFAAELFFHFCMYFSSSLLDSRSASFSRLLPEFEWILRRFAFHSHVRVTSILFHADLLHVCCSVALSQSTRAEIIESISPSYRCMRRYPCMDARHGSLLPKLHEISRKERANFAGDSVVSLGNRTSTIFRVSSRLKSGLSSLLMCNAGRVCVRELSFRGERWQIKDRFSSVRRRL